MGLVRHSDVKAPMAVLRTRIAASYLGSGYNRLREQARSHKGNGTNLKDLRKTLIQCGIPIAKFS